MGSAGFKRKNNTFQQPNYNAADASMSKVFIFFVEGLRILFNWSLYIRSLTKTRNHNRSWLRPVVKLELELKCPKESFQPYPTNQEQSILPVPGILSPR